MELPLLFTISLFLIFFLWLGLTKHTNDTDEFHNKNRKIGLWQTSVSVFTVIGAPHFTFITFFAFAFGWWPLSLYFGSFVGFIILSFLSKRIRGFIPVDAHSAAEIGASHSKFAAFTLSLAGGIFSFGALATQIVTGAVIISTLTGVISHELAIIVLCIVIILYLLPGGYASLIVTDFYQGIASLILAALLASVLVSNVGLPQLLIASDFRKIFNPPEIMIMLFFAGVFIELGAPVNWQRILTAEDNKTARSSMILGGSLVLLGGSIICLIGISIATLYPDMAPQNAFVEYISTHLSNEFKLVAVALLLFTLLSTADSALYVTTIMAEKEYLRRIGEKTDNLDITMTRIVIIILGCSLCIVASLFPKEVEGAFGILLNIGFFTGPLAISILLRRGGVNVETQKITYITALFISLLGFCYVLLFVGGQFLSYWSFLLIIPACIPLLIPGPETINNESMKNKD